MDLFTTALELAGIEPPTDHTIIIMLLVSHQLGSVMDLFPTALELSRIEPPTDHNNFVIG